MTAPTIADLEAAPRADLARLVEDAKAGRPLNGAERRLVADELARLKAEAAGAEADRAEEAGRAGVVRRTRSLAETAEAFGISLRTANYWEKRGKEAGDPVPWDDPAQIPTWYPRHHKGRTLSGGVWRNVAAAGREKQAQNPPPGAFDYPSSATTQGEAATPATVEDTMRSAFVRLTTEMAGLGADLERLKSAKDVDEGLIRSKRDELLACMEKARQLSKGIQQDMIARGEFVSRAVVGREFAAVHLAVRAAMRSEFRRAELELRSAANSDAWGVAVDHVCDRVDRTLCENEFGEAESGAA
jgi:hypothetical protein